MYYELLAKRREEKIEHIAIVRIEQLYPFPADELKEVMAQYPKVKQVVWCQEEPKNQGAFRFIEPNFRETILKGRELEYIGRKASAAPATGISKRHKEEIEEIFNRLKMK